MTLYDRVKKAGNAVAEARPATQSELLQELRQQVHALMSVDELALMSAENPERARNEVRSACRRAFEDAFWAHVDGVTRESLTNSLIDIVFGFGAIEELLDDEAITEIMVNGPSSVYFERDGRLIATDLAFGSEADLRALIDRILGPVGRRIDEASPMVNARLPQGHRVNVVVPPIAPDGPLVTIRKFTEHVITLEEMVESGSVEPSVRLFLTWAVRARKSIAVVGGTGSGKTTLLNALSCKIPHDERIVTIEDSAELRFFEHPHVARLEARPRNAEGAGEVTIRDLVANALRMRPDRIVVGECRGAEAADMLQAMLTGHDGSMTTLHANSPAEVVPRLVMMVRFGMDLPVEVIESQIGSALDLVVQQDRVTGGARKITQIAMRNPRLAQEGGHRRFFVPIVEWDRIKRRYVWHELPDWIDEISYMDVATREEVLAWQRSVPCS